MCENLRLERSLSSEAWPTCAEFCKEKGSTCMKAKNAESSVFDLDCDSVPSHSPLLDAGKKSVTCCCLPGPFESPRTVDVPTNMLKDLKKNRSDWLNTKLKESTLVTPTETRHCEMSPLPSSIGYTNVCLLYMPCGCTPNNDANQVTDATRDWKVIGSAPQGGTKEEILEWGKLTCLGNHGSLRDKWEKYCNQPVKTRFCSEENC